MPRPVLQLVLASTRPGRVGLPVATWLRQVAEAHGGFEVELIDLAQVALPLMDEPHHPRLRQYTHQHTRDWSATVARGDAYLFVFPEYNHAMTAPLKNALDYLSQEWACKPAGLASYGGVSAGLRAAQQLKQVLTALKVVPLPEAVAIPFVTQFLDEGVFVPNDQLTAGATVLLDELLRWSGPLSTLRQAAG